MIRQYRLTALYSHIFIIKLKQWGAKVVTNQTEEYLENLEVSVPIPGTTKLHRLEENIGAVSIELTPDDLRDIDEARLEDRGARGQIPRTPQQATCRCAAIMHEQASR